MLQLKHINKDYITSSERVHALRDVTISFRKTEFVSILGPSGCGKTTLLNLIGGLDHYTDGELIISDRSTKGFSDRDWDVYRNHKVGFIFQSYNLIPHQNVLTNVELALTIAGVSKEERVERAKRALDRVGLEDQYYKRPNQLSGGQCQRVAIARALVNDPEILLADEPTGALDTGTSVQIMELIKEISKERLVIMVTHNPELAEEYSTRIVRLLDGRVTEDTNPMTDDEVQAEIDEENKKKAEEAKVFETLEPKEARKLIKARKEKAKMSFFTAFKLSLKNLFTKKGRSTLTAFAGSIGIIGIALILAVSQGTTSYIDDVQESTLSSYPLTLEATTVDITSLIEKLTAKDEEPGHPLDGVYKDHMIGELVDAVSKIQKNENDLAAFKVYLESELAKPDSALSGAVSGVQYTYDINIPIYTKNPEGNIIKSDKGELLSKMISDYMIGLAEKEGFSSSLNGMGGSNTSSMSSAMMVSMMDVKLWQELLPGRADESGKRPFVNDLLLDQYDVVYGKWPSAANEVVLVLNEHNEIDDLTLYALGLLSEGELDAIIDSALYGTPMPEGRKMWTYEEICSLTFKTILPYDFYMDNGDGVYKNMSSEPLVLNTLYSSDKVFDIKVVGVIRPSEDADAAMLKGSLAYTYEFTEHVIREAYNSDVVKAQLANPNIDVTTGLPFKANTGNLTPEEKEESFRNYLTLLDSTSRAEAYVEILCLLTEKGTLEQATDQFLSEQVKTKADAIAYITDFVKANNPSFDTNTIAGLVEKMELAAIKAYIRPYVEDYCREIIHQGVKANYYTTVQVGKDQKEIINPELVPTLNAELDQLLENEEMTTLANFTEWYDKVTIFSDKSYKETLTAIGCVNLDTPHTINLYASTFEDKDVIVQAIKDYNDSVPEEKKIVYTDIIGLLMSSITTIINAITYVLIAFVSIALIVSSIMIGVITLISVQERTKEIGILRAIGASKRDVSSMFNAETIIIGLASGLLGVAVTYILCIPINIVIHAVTELPNLSARLPIGGALILISISVLLTLISGLIPSRSAAKKDPVVALRTE